LWLCSSAAENVHRLQCLTILGAAGGKKIKKKFISKWNKVSILIFI
jgi:hypothetical protein